MITPLWNIYHSGDAFTQEQKQNFANDITKLYSGFGLPDFYVVVVFHFLGMRSPGPGTEAEKLWVREIVPCPTNLEISGEQQT